MEQLSQVKEHLSDSMGICDVLKATSLIVQRLHEQKLEPCS